MTREEAIDILNDERIVIWTEPDEEEIARKQNEAIDMAIESLSAEQKEEELAKDIARRMATIIENEQDMRVILKNASAEPTVIRCRTLLTDEDFKMVAKQIRETNQNVIVIPCEAEVVSTETSTETSTDLISRADAMMGARPEYLNPNDDYARGWNKAIEEYWETIKALPSADRPAKLLKDGTLKVNAQNGAEVNRVLVWGDDGCGGLYYADDRPSGEWVESLERNDTMHWFSFSGYCTNCGEWSEYLTTYCGECGAVMYALNNNGELVKHDGAKMGGE